MAVTTKLLIATAAALTAIAMAGLAPAAAPSAGPPVYLVIEETGGTAPVDYDCPYEESLS